MCKRLMLLAAIVDCKFSSMAKVEDYDQKCGPEFAAFKSKCIVWHLLC